MEEELDAFLRRIQGFEAVSRKHTTLIPYFAYFLTAEMHESTITPSRIKACYDAARISAPRNISDVMRKSGAFIQTTSGAQLHRTITDQLAAMLREAPPAVSSEVESPGRNDQNADKAATVVVVHGRDERIRNEMFQFLRCLKLQPIEWNEAVHSTGKASPYTGEVVEALFRNYQAVVVLLTPDEYVELRADLRDPPSAAEIGWQPRPNVILEMGMALCKDPDRTILVQVGELRKISDLEGRNIIHLDGSAPKRNALLQRLRTAGCAAESRGSDWLTSGKFKVEQRRKPTLRRIAK